MITIACLPVAGPDNPYQHLMMDGLNQDPQIRAFNGTHDKFLGIARTLLVHHPTFLHFDWVSSYYYRRWKWLTYVSVVGFCAQIMLAQLMGVKVVWTLHNLLPHDTSTPNIHRFCQRFLARRCQWIRVFSASSVTRAAAELGVSETRFRILPEGGYVKVYANHLSRNEARRQLKLDLDTKVFVYVGLIKPYKGILELMHAFATLQPANVHLIIAGKIMDTAYGDAIRRELSDAITLVDQFIPEDEFQVYFNAADVVVLPFQKIENSGSVILSMGFAKPIIAPRLGVLQERLSQQDDWLYDSAQELPAKLRYALDIPADALETVGSRNFGALAKYTWADFATLFL